MQDVEINYMLDPSMGYATEAARGLLAIDFRRHDLRRMDLCGGRFVDPHTISRETWEMTEDAAKMHVG